MSTITRKQIIEKLQHRISVASGFPESEKAQMDLELARIALASLEAEAVAWRCGSTVTVNKPVADDWKRRGFAFHPLYAAPPALVSVPTFEEWCKRTEQKPVGWVRDAMKEAYDACRAAMLQGVETITRA